MKYEQVKHLKPGEFKRFWGVTYETFEKMVEIVTLHEGQKKKTGRPGKMHDFRLFKHSRLPLRQRIECLVDKGYQGIQKLHANSKVPQKKPRKGTLSDEAKKRNRELARQRVIGEHVHRKLKIFKI